MFIQLQPSLLTEHLNCGPGFYGPVEIHFLLVFIFTITLNLMEKYSKKRAMGVAG